MKKTLLLVMVIVLSMIPTAPALAQSDDPVSPACDPEFVLSDFEFMFSDVASFEDLIGALSFGSFVVMDCFDDWLTLLLDFAVEEFGGDLPLPIPQPAPDIDGDAAGAVGSLTARDAERAITAAFLGDIELANEYVCISERLDTDEGTAFSDDLTINEVSCQRLGEVMNCTFSISSEATGDLEDELNFEIVDELLCTTLD